MYGPGEIVSEADQRNASEIAVFRVLNRQYMRERVHLALRPPECDSVAQATDYVQPETIAALARAIIHYERSPKIEIVLWKADHRRRHAGHLVRTAAQVQLPADNRRVAAKLAEPEFMADEDLARAALLTVAGFEVLAILGAHSHHTEEIRGHLGSAKLKGLGASGENQTCGSESGHALEPRRQSSSRGRFEMSRSNPCLGLRIQIRTS